MTIAVVFLVTPRSVFIDLIKNHNKCDYESIIHMRVNRHSKCVLSQQNALSAVFLVHLRFRRSDNSSVQYEVFYHLIVCIISNDQTVKWVKKDYNNLTWAMMVVPSAAYMVHDLSSQLPLILKSNVSSLVLPAKNTSNWVLN